ncbi:hypothetical protein [Methylocystis hirsuta]|nr:hypothetical protein [Methylocystis hirsuta]
MSTEGRPDDRQVETIASAIYLNLRRLQLYVTLKSYGPGFWEIFASTSPKMIVKAGNDKASGISLMLTNRYDPPELYIEEINSLRAGLGRTDGRRDRRCIKVPTPSFSIQAQ